MSDDNKKELSDQEIMDIWKNTQYDYIRGELSWMTRIIMTVREAIEQDRQKHN